MLLTRNPRASYRSCASAVGRCLKPAPGRRDIRAQVAPRVTTFFTPEGVVQIRDPVPPRQPCVIPGFLQGFPLHDEQKLVVGASFLITGSQSVDVLFDSVEYTVHANRGSILEERRLLKSGIHEVLKLTVAIPYLWGVPPQLDMLNMAIKEGGGFIDRVNHEWLILSRN